MPFHSLRDARSDDLPQLLDIYNHYVAHSTVTFDEQPIPLSAMREKFDRVQQLGLPFLVAEGPAQRVLGFAYAAPWRPKAAYRHTVEDSIYLGAHATGQGVGTALLTELVERCAAAGVRELIAVIADEGSEASIRLHRAAGFEQVGHLARVGVKFGRSLGTVLMQKSLVEP